MPRTKFTPQVHGFTFTNSWKFADKERKELRDKFSADLKLDKIFGQMIASLLSDSIHYVIDELGDMLGNKLGQDIYGLCGGMCLTALDFFRADLPVPKGKHRDDQPALDKPLGRYIHERQLDSMVSDVARYLLWMIILHYIDSDGLLRGGTDWILAQSKQEWEKLKASVDDDKPAPIWLLRSENDIYGNHQVLAIGYDEADENHDGVIYLYDPNCPNTESSIKIKFGKHKLDGTESCGKHQLRGFFCGEYEFSDPTVVSSDN